MRILFLSVLVGLFASCSSGDEMSMDINSKKSTLSALTPKDRFVADLKAAFGNVKKGEKPHLSMEQINYLEQSAKRMLKAEGMFSRTMKKLEKQNPAGLILTGTIYLGLSKIMEAQNEMNANSTDSISALKCDTTGILSSRRDSVDIPFPQNDTVKIQHLEQLEK